MLVHRSERMEALVDALDRVVSEPLSSPFVAETIVVPSRSLAAWLSLRLAERQGIWAHPRFIAVDAFLAKLHASVVVGARAAGDDLFTREGLAWSIAAVLRSLFESKRFASVAAYLADDTDITKRLALARRLGRTFHGYLVHRPEMLATWERSAEETKNETVAWEAELWRALVAKHGADHVANRNRALLDALAALGSSEATARATPARPPAGLPERVSIFAPESLPEIAIDILHALGELVDVHVFLRRGEHALTESLGARGRDLAASLAEREGVAMLDEPSTPSRPSLAVHACHAPMRECEVLRDQLLAALDEDPSLEPRDILVLCPDLETYRPVIDAVFGTDERAKGYLPYRIVDGSARRGLTVVEGFLAMLDVAPSRGAAPDVVDLLAREPVRTKFALDENEIDVVRQWIADCGIRWGEDEEHRRDVGQPALRDNTWRFGLDRLLLGFAMGGGDDQAMCEGCLPYDDVEGTTSDTLGGFATFCEQLFIVRKELLGLAPISAWRDRLVDALGRLFSAPWQTEFQHQMVREALGDLVARAEAGGFIDEVPLAVVHEALTDEVDERAASLEHAHGGITFAAFTSSRCVPARVLVMLGMNDGDFPRAPRADTFDLVATRPRRGDPSTRDEDRQAFLDALLCARDRVIVTYVGQSIANNAERPPSVVVSELLDLEGESQARARLVVKHALHAFSPRYFGGDDDPRLFSYAAALCDGAQSSMRGERDELPSFVKRPLPASDRVRTVTVDALARFFEHPVRGFVQTRLGVSLGRDLRPLEDREPLELDNLDKWKLGTPLLERARDGEDIVGVPPDIAAGGSLPLGVVRQFAYDDVVPNVLELVRALRPLLDPSTPAPPPLHEIDLEIGDTRIVGSLRNVGSRGQVLYTYSKLQGKHRLGAWIRHLAMQCAGIPKETWLVGRHARSVRSLHYGTIRDPAAILARLVDLYWRGLEAPLLFFSDASVTYATTLDEKGPEAAMARARKELYSEFGSANDAYVKKAFSDRDPLDAAFEPFAEPRDRARFPSFAELAVAVCGPLLAHEESAE